MSVAGSICRIESMGFWWAAIPETRWPQDEGFRAQLMRSWSPAWGDRRQELVFIGVAIAD
jgi:hypothetical protein